MALESVVLRDLPAARDFMMSELGPIGDDDPRTELLRGTLRAYFDTGQNAAATAARIQVHERTVAYRLKSIEDRLGFSISHRRDELGGRPSTGRCPAGRQRHSARHDGRAQPERDRYLRTSSDACCAESRSCTRSGEPSAIQQRSF